MAGGQNLGEAVLKITLDTKTLKTQLDQLKKDIEGVQAGPVKLKPDGTSTRSKTTPADTAAKKAAADEARRVASLNALEARRFRIGRELNKLEERGVNISRLRSKLESNTLRRSSSQAEITSAREQTRSLERQVALRKDLADKEKRANAAKKDTTTPTPPAEAVKPAAVSDPRSVQRSLRSTRVDLTNLSRQGGDTNRAAESFNAAVEASQKGQLKNARELIAETRTRIKEERSLLDAINDQGQAAANVGKPKGESSRLLTDINTNKSRLLRQNPGANLTEIDAKQAQAVDAAGKGQAAVVRRLKGEIDTLIRAERERLAQLKATTTELGKQKTPSGGGGGGGPTGPSDPTRPRKTQAERDAEAAKRKADSLAKQQKQDNSARLNSGLVGGAFPLMFGQGGFAALGGAIGGSAGGGELGFGLSLVGTAIGSQIDELNKRFEGLGVALRSPIESLDVFIEQATLASSAQDKLVKSLVDAGQFGSAEEILRSESARTVDPLIAEGVAANNEKYNRALSDTRDLLGQITSGPTSAFLSFLAGVLNTVNNVPEADPEAPAGDRLAATKQKATEDKQKGQLNAALGLAFGISNPFTQVQGLVGQGQASFSEGTERAASSKEVLALETKLTKQKQNQKALEAASLVAKREGRSELAAALTAQAKLSALSVEQTAGESAIQQQLARDKDGINDDKDKSKSLDDISALRERIKLQKELIKVESAADARNSTLAANKAKQLQGLEGAGRSIREREIDVERARADTKRASELLGKSTPGEKQVAENALTTAKNTQFVAQLALEREQLTVKREFNRLLESEQIIRRGIAQQITASIAQQGAALARGDSAANPGNSVLAARAGDAEARAFLEQNRQGVNSARSAEAQLQNQIKFEVDPSKIAELQSKLATAAQATKLAMVEAGTALASKAADAAASLQGAREGLRGLLENNIDKLPGQAQVDLKRSALGDVQRGVQSGILRPNINFNNTKSLLENASFVRQVEVARAQVSAAEAQVEALKENTVALLTPGAINVTINSDGAGGWQSGGAERVAA